MQADLKKGVQEATMFVQGGETDKKKLKKKFNKIEKKYDLVELKLVVDKENPEGKDKVHIRGEVNPVIEGDSFEVELDESGNELAPGATQKKFGILLSRSITNRKGSLEGSGTKLAKNLSDDFPIGTRSNYQAHHLIATSSANASASKSGIMKAAAETGYNINRGTNGVWLPNSLSLAEQVGRPAHTGKHMGKYFNTVVMSINTIENAAVNAKSKKKPWTEEKLISEIGKGEDNLRSRLMNMQDPMKLQYDDRLKPDDPDPTKDTS